MTSSMRTPSTADRPAFLARGFHFRGTLVLLCLLLFSSSSGAHAVVVHPPPPKIFNVAGRVVTPWTDGTNQPVPAAVALAKYSDRAFLAPVHVVTADEKGHFSIPHVPRGRYWLRVSLPGFSTFTAQVQVIRYSLRPHVALLVTIYTPSVGADPSSIGTEPCASSPKAP